jgi:pyruvate,water dikinase
MGNDKAIVWFHEVGKDDVGLVGGKGANLGEMTQAKIPVPPGFIVTSPTYFRFLDASGLRPLLERALAGLDHHNNDALQQASRQIKQTIIDAPVPEEIAREIKEAYRQLGRGAVAVRSSATAEDLPTASFAGQQSTFLNIEGEDQVVQAVRACWASLFEARAIFYRVENGFEHMKVGIAVPVQRMVQSERSGVMFSVEPNTSDPTKVYIEAVCGLGEAIVSGQVTPDEYTVDKKSLQILKRKVASQEQQLVRGKSGQGSDLDSNVWVEVPAALRASQKLTDDDVVKLADIARRLEQHYGLPQDIEWAKEDSNLYLVQTRPVTTIRGMAEEQAAEETAPLLLEGSPASPGVEAGPVKIVMDPSEIGKVVKGDILVAEMTTPDFVPAMKRAVAIVTDRGGRTAHAAIVSRELGIPCVVGTGSATKTLKGEQVVTVDGSRGRVYDGRAEASLAWAVKEKERYAAAASLKTKTKVYVNLAEPELADVIAARACDGVGLLRAEFIIAQIGEHPRFAIDEGRSEEFIVKLADGLRKFASAFDPRPVVYRMTDFKTNEYSNLRGGERYELPEENPMIGYRGASRYVSDVDVFELEVEAIKRVRAEYKNLWVMIPFVRTPAELAGVRDLMIKNGLAQSEEFKLWMMAEVPSNVFILDKFIDVGIDGISIGSNDLTQLILGIDRDSERLAKLFDERDEAVMLALEKLITTARRRGITSSICGQAPSDYPELAQKLVEWGITSLSVNPDVIERTRQLIHDLEQKVGTPA